ncbi:hypothetical protein XELAEV_18043910mg [Xenopus laevis]|uniref:Uncharacterized protein n=1 Tax=Xenopus laevis TaxID=8355 RepID=A0A974BXL3_XENLA|nr:hypothetical protein XELAEV_18043910mg [Xenopus laevis]
MINRVIVSLHRSIPQKDNHSHANWILIADYQALAICMCLRPTDCGNWVFSLGKGGLLYSGILKDTHTYSHMKKFGNPS